MEEKIERVVVSNFGVLIILVKIFTTLRKKENKKIVYKSNSMELAKMV